MMKTIKVILMAGLLTSVFSASTCFAEQKDPNDAPVSGAQAVVVGEKCDVCQANTSSGTLKKEDPHRYDALLPDGAASKDADKTGTADKGSH